MTEDFGGLAATGSDVTPWLMVAGIIVLLGVIALVIAGVIRSRRAQRQVEDAAEAGEADPGSAADVTSESGSSAASEDGSQPSTSGDVPASGDDVPKG